MIGRSRVESSHGTLSSPGGAVPCRGQAMRVADEPTCLVGDDKRGAAINENVSVSHPSRAGSARRAAMGKIDGGGQGHRRSMGRSPTGTAAAVDMGREPAAWLSRATVSAWAGGRLSGAVPVLPRISRIPAFPFGRKCRRPAGDTCGGGRVSSLWIEAEIIQGRDAPFSRRSWTKSS